MDRDILLMIGISLLAGSLSTMNMWVVNKSHVKTHLNDIYMTLLMTGWMILLTYLLLNHMMSSKIWFFVSIIIIVLVIYAIRTQALIGDKQFLRGMIPHHSMAILMAEKIKDKTKDNRIKELANNIIKSQSQEIKQMTEILDNPLAQ